METWYRAQISPRIAIEEVEVQRATPCCVYIRGRQHNQLGAQESYFRTWDQAHFHLLERQRAAIYVAAKYLLEARQALEAINALRPETYRGEIK